ncbi:MAG: GNAT family N-acetyltransferase [Kiloniellales bacterium]
MAITVRRAEPRDAGTISSMVQALGVVMQNPEFDLNVEVVLRDGFGPEPWFTGFVAERDGSPLGIVVAQRGYAVDRGSRGLYINALYVEAEARGQGVGRALMCAVAEQARAVGGQWIAWDVGVENAPAKRFYDRLGARYLDEVVMMVLQGEALEALKPGGAP